MTLATDLRRVVWILAVVTLHGATVWAGALARAVPGVRRLVPTASSAPQRFRRLLERLGGTFVKFGQVLSLQPDLVSPETCDALFDLLDRMPPFGFSRVERVVRDELGRGPDEIFDGFEREPLGAASIGQVHVAELGGRKLAVKVQRPTAGETFGSDIRLMKLALAVIRRLGARRLEWLRQPLGDFIGLTSEELDYRIEARYMDQMARNSRDRDSERVPEVLWELTSRRVLVADYLEGATLLQYLRAREEGDEVTLARVTASGFEPGLFAENILDNFLTDVFRHGLFHADLHPANLMILPDNQVGYVDFGISGVISGFSRRRLLSMVVALIRGDLGGLADHMLDISRVRVGGDLAAFRRGMRQLELEWYRGRGDDRERLRSYSLMMLDMLRVCRQNRVLPHVETMRYMRSVVTADGLISRFAPEVDVDEVLDRFCSRLIGSDAVRSAVSLDRALAFWSAGARLLRDGPSRLERLVATAGGGASGSAGPAAVERDSDSAESARPALAAVSLLLLMALVLPATPAAPGLNLFSAGVVLMSASAAVLVVSLVRWRLPAE